MLGKWAGAITAMAALTAVMVTKLESDPKALPEIKHVKEDVKRVASDVDNLEQAYREQQLRQLEILKEENEYLDRQRHEPPAQRRSAPPATSQPWPMDPQPRNPPSGYYKRGQQQAECWSEAMRQWVPCR